MASYAMPADIAPSPITAMLLRFLSPFNFAAVAMPSAAEMLVDECAVPKVSYSDSTLRGNPEMPPFCRNVCMRSRRPVRILCG